jgi:hypothetical protein
MEKQSKVLLEEIQQVISQYRREVPGRRRAWPESVKNRVVQLCALGVEPKRVAKMTSLSYYTILSWIPDSHRRRYRPRQASEKSEARAHFAPVSIRQQLPDIASVTVAMNSTVITPTISTNATVTVTLPDGIRIEGVSAEFLRSWLGKGGGQ